MVESTSSRSRLELTASPTSRSASSSSTLLRQLGAARLEVLHELDLTQHDRGLQRELLQQLLVVQVEVGDPGVEHRQAPTTSSSRISGVDRSER